MSRLSSFLSTGKSLINTVGEVLSSGPRPRLEEFQEHWKHVSGLYSGPVDDATPVYQTPIPSRLERMVQLLREEEDQAGAAGGRDAGPCLEFFLQHRLLETLAALGQADCPQGMRGLILQTMAQLISGLRHPLLPQMAIHKPLCHMLMSCRRSVPMGAPERPHLLRLVCALLQKLQQNPTFIGFFMNLEPERAPDTSAQTFSLLPFLVPHLNDTDMETGDQTRAGILTCLALPSSDVQTYLIENSGFAPVMASGVAQAFSELAGAPAGTTAARDANDMLCHRVLYANAIVREAPPRVSAAIITTLRRSLLESILRPALLQASESGAAAATRGLLQMLELIDAPALVTLFSSFLLGDASGPEREDAIAEHEIRFALISRMDSQNEQLAIVTLSLFEALLTLHSRHIVHNLLLRNLQPGRHVQATEQRDVHITRVSSVNTSIQRFMALAQVAETSSADPHTYHRYLVDAEQSTTLCMQRCESWELAESAALFGTDPGADFDPEDVFYGDDAPVNDTSDEALQRTASLLSIRTHASVDSADAVPFFEGHFLQVLFNVLERLLDTPISVSVRVTGLLYRLALHPDPLLHAYMLDTELALQPGVRSLYRVLCKLAAEAQATAEQDSRFAQRLASAKQSLGVTERDGDSTSADADAVSGAARLAGQDGGSELQGFQDHTSSDNLAGVQNSKFFAGVVVLEQFSLELAATLQAKNSISRDTIEQA